MSKTRLKMLHKSLAIFFILFFTTILLSALGFKNLSKLVLYAIFPVFFWGYFHGAIFVFKSNKKFFSRIKHKQTIFTDSLTDDEDDPPYQTTTLNKDKGDKL
ncbi:MULTISPECIES: hypothetical protein [unclassified Psychrobacter]|uniref:hypothetical protein n=1 Tax=unclassified Psychrobacter TaxID=196806 RepID=UPI001788718C|nr:MULTISPECIES: hypothetical protein [unclassified Psychrobacter]MBE0442494.1 hypothetical protein [Psychrobacter sp. FME13]